MNIKYFKYDEIKTRIPDVEHDVYNLFYEVICEEDFFKKISFDEFNRI